MARKEVKQVEARFIRKVEEVGRRKEPAGRVANNY